MLYLLKHPPQRPEWVCVECGEPWPCEPAKIQLRADYRTSVELALVTWDAFEKAVFDLGASASADALYRRFIKWTWR